MNPQPSRPREIVLATRNPGKLREIRAELGHLPVRVLGLADLPDVDEPAETGATFAENARDKALYYARRTGRWCLADDSGLAVDALGGEPGIRSARYAAETFPPHADRAARDAANTAKLLAAMSDADEPRRTARFVCHLALADPRGVLIETSAALAGRITREGAGENGFGYDPVFFVPEAGCTAAEMPPEAKNAVSHRGQAVRQFAARLKALLARTDLQGDAP